MKQEQNTNTNNKKWSKKKKIVLISSIIATFLLVVAASVAIPLVVYNTHAATPTTDGQTPPVQTETKKITTGKVTKYDDGTLSAYVFFEDGTVELAKTVVEASRTAATCGTAGKVVYTLTLQNGETTTVEEEIPALNHKAEDIPGKSATCTEAGLTEGQRCSECGEILVEQTEIPALGHTWNFTDFVWANNFETCEVLYTCSTCNETRTSNIEVLKQVVEPTCEESGLVTYSVSLTYDGVEYTDYKTDELEPTGHNWSFTRFVWSEDLTTAKAEFICQNDMHHFKYEDVEVVIETAVEPTCHKEGLKTYTITTEYETEVKEEILPALGHEWVIVYESENMKIERCSRCGAERLTYITVNPDTNVTTTTVVVFDTEE